MADVPLLETRCFRFKMELQRKSILTERKRLIFIELGTGKPYRPAREIERVAMPVEDLDVGV
jgi:hypothetical protein